MVGPIRNLEDLRRIEAAVRVTCNKCGAVELIEREALLHERTGLNLSRTWASVRADQSCRRCHARDVEVEALPFSENSRELRRRRAENILINLALHILADAARRSTVGAVGSIEVRLALRVLDPFVADRNLMLEYWREATEMPRKGWSSCHLPLRWIVKRLVERGYGVNAEYR
ncbi:hypothetical protein QH494_17015 [Sphingomonas sp. AR_OL41]|uniref:hypothetical protein n=1 Tax=Sphingomonas sp. AR_OL41 TaxID=3042729 RepID=UPI00247FC3D2|nr:hypothetical protein [Sphingomonas sp. AR_OL41]MDH7973894.1 hypothetical protein [Sphingomonas sp. AR_OL41]